MLANLLGLVGVAGASLLPCWPPTHPPAALAATTHRTSIIHLNADADGNADGIRVNKALRATHSRRAADALIADGRVSVNDELAEPGSRLVRGDEVRLDGDVVDWERLNPPTVVDDSSRFVYLKLWKQRGVVCTTDQRQRNNIIDALGPVPGVSDRIYPIGRLDADSTGLILLTSDGTIVNGLLRSSERKSKEYIVSTSRRASDAQIARLARGVTITTVAQRDGNAKPLTAPTKPCVVERIATGHDECRLRFVLQEGRNRQIRRMCEAVGLSVVRLHRVGFAGISLGGDLRSPGDWSFLTKDEVAICRSTGAGAGAAKYGGGWGRPSRAGRLGRGYAERPRSDNSDRGGSGGRGRGSSRRGGRGLGQPTATARRRPERSSSATTTWRRGDG